jgi:hypothetical protein
MSKARGPVWVRFVAPSILLLALAVAAFPVLELGLEGAPETFDSWNHTREFMGRKKAAADGKLVVMTQNGFEAIWAGYSWGPEIADEKAEEARQRRSHPNQGHEQLEAARKKFEEMVRENGGGEVKWTSRVVGPWPAVLMLLYLLLVLLAVAVGYGLPSGLPRTILFCVTIVLAGACLGLQLLIGFPFAGTVPREVTGMKHFIDNPPRLLPGGKWEEGGKVTVFVRRLPWDMLAWPVLVGAMGVAGVELLLVRGAPGKKSSARAAREDDRPKRRRSGEDEVRRPSKRGRARDDEDEGSEEERPPRARRR